jgi:GNAT superfamily N-acetyltransferase
MAELDQRVPARPAFRLREAGPADARAIAAVQVAGWRESYAKWLSPAFFAGVSVAARADRMAERIAEPGVRTVVAEVDGEVVGYSAAGLPREADGPLPTELYAVYQLAMMHGSGSGQALLDAAVGTAPAYLWVLERNLRAQSFYRRNGFDLDGTTRPLDSFEGLIESRMRRSASLEPLAAR